jgi:hypothetical protein
VQYEARCSKGLRHSMISKLAIHETSENHRKRHCLSECSHRCITNNHLGPLEPILPTELSHPAIFMGIDCAMHPREQPTLSNHQTCVNAPPPTYHNDMGSEYHGHQVSHIKVVRDSLAAQGKRAFVYLMGDSSLDNKLAIFGLVWHLHFLGFTF